MRSTYTLFQLISIVSPCYAQTSKLFQWKFANNFVSTSLPTCQNLSIIVESYNADNSTHGTPPYYMMAFEVNGVPTTTFIGTDENNLNWQVNHAANTQLLLSVVDANGSAGGVPPHLFNVSAEIGQSTQCLPSTTSTASDFTISANVTTGKDLSTCQPWGISITGGIPPYVVTLPALNSPVVTNVTLEANEDHFTYINRAEPNTQLLVAVSDLTGRFASGTVIVDTIGSTDANCTGLNSSGGTSAQIQQEEQAGRTSQRSRKRTRIIIGVVVTLVSLLLLSGVGLLLFWRRKKAMEREAEHGDLTPRTFDVTQVPKEGQVLSIVSFVDSPVSTSPATPASNATPSSTPSRYAEASPYARKSGGSLSSRPSFNSFPTVATRRYNKAAEAGVALRAMQISGSRPESSIMDSDVASGSHSLGSNQPPSGAQTDGEIIIQHRDGGGVIRELPPPYADRSVAQEQ